MKTIIETLCSRQLSSQGGLLKYKMSQLYVHEPNLKQHLHLSVLYSRPAARILGTS